MPDLDLHPADCQAVLVDVQERFLPAIPAIAVDAPCGRACRILLEGLAALDVPVTLSEQAPDKLGPTLPFLAAAAPGAPVLAKTAFSLIDDPALKAHLAGRDRRRLILAGIEAHICVLASVDDALRHGWDVIVASDAVASRRDDHREAALATMRQLGALVVPVESILLRLQRVARGETFKAISRLIR